MLRLYPTPQRMPLRNENMSLRKVYGGTPIGNESRCDTCTHARIIQGYAESERIVICTGMYDPIRIPFKVMQCTDYEDRRLPDFDNMKEIAWQIRSKNAGSVAGFVTLPEKKDPQDLQNEAAPEEIPAKIPSSFASRRAVSIESSGVTVIISS